MKSDLQYVFLASIFVALLSIASSANAEPGTPKAPVSVGEVRALDGPVKVQSAVTGGWADLKERDRVYSGDTVRALGGGRARIELADHSTLNLGENSEMKIREVTAEGEKRQTTIQLLGGKVRALVPRLYGDAGSLYRIASPNAVTSVRGTEFAVLVDANHSTQVIVLEGEVEVRNLFDADKTYYPIPSGSQTIVEGRNRPSPAEKSDASEVKRLREQTTVSTLEVESELSEKVELEIPPIELEPVRAFIAKGRINVLPLPERGRRVDRLAVQPPVRIEPYGIPVRD